MTNGPSHTAVEAPVASDQRLDDVLLAMDVVDTLRHREQLVIRELDTEGREAELIERLKDIYQAQGIEVPERILKDGVKALEEKRFSYSPPQASLMVSLARIYVSRDRWIKPFLASFVAIVAGLGLYQVGIAGPEKARTAAIYTELSETLPTQLQTLRTDIQELAVEDRVDALAETLYQEGLAATEDSDAEKARGLVTDLERLKTDLTKTYEVRVRYGNGAQSGIFRIPENRPDQRNYYLIVEAIDPRGNVVDVPIINEETQTQQRTSVWGQRVTAEVFNRVAADKTDDQIIQDDIIGQKPIGRLNPVYTVETPGGAILEW